MPIKTYTYSTFGDGQTILADVHYNDHVHSKQQAIALAIHAGGFVMGKRDTIAPNFVDALLSHDFVVVSIDYRLCPQISLHDGPIQDTRDAYRWCRHALPQILKTDAGLDVDGSRVVALGWSAGGHLSMMLGSEEEKPNAILNCYGPLYFQDPSYRKPVHKIMSLIPEGPLHFDEAFMNKVYDEPLITYTDNTVKFNTNTGAPEIDFEQPRNAWSFGNISRGTWIDVMQIEGQEEMVDPALHLDSHFPPTMFLWGELDELVPAELARRAYEKLKELDVDTDIIIAEGFGHAFGAEHLKGTSNYQEYVIKPVEFLAKYVQN